MVEKEFYSVGEVSKILGLSPERIYEYLRMGHIKGSRLTKSSAWRVHKDELQRIKAGKEIAQPEQQAPSGKLERLARMEQERVEPPLAREWGEQLSCPPPETVLIDSLGRMGDNSATLGQDILNVALENLRFDIRVSQTTSYPNYTHAGGQVFWELPLHGPPKLLCPVERRPGFEELLSKITGEARESFSGWKSLGGRFLVACMSARSAIQDEANARAGGLVTVNSLFAKIRSDFTLPPGPPLPMPRTAPPTAPPLSPPVINL